MRKLLPAILLATLAIPRFATAQNASAEEEVRQTILTMTAVYKDNLPKYWAYFDPNALMLWSWRPGRTTVQDYQNITKTRPDYESTSVGDLLIAIDPAGDKAVASYVLTTKNVGKDPARYLMYPVLYRRDGKWQIVYLHATTMRPPSPPAAPR